jgi:hypothetical protein
MEGLESAAAPSSAATVLYDDRAAVLGRTDGADKTVSGYGVDPRRDSSRVNGVEHVAPLKRCPTPEWVTRSAVKPSLRMETSGVRGQV